MNSELTTTQARLAEAIALLDEFSHRSLFGNSQLSSDGHLGICSFRGVKPEECRVCGTTIRTLKFLSSTESPVILKELEELRGNRPDCGHLKRLTSGSATIGEVCNACAAESAEARLMESDKLVEKYATDLAFLQSKLAEAEKDKARLDWLESWPTGALRKFCDTSNGLQYPWEVHRTGEFLIKRKQLREAIDAAMKQTT